MLLEKKSVLIHGGGGAIGGTVARVFAREGARLFLTGRTMARLEPVAAEIRAAGGAVETAVLDALDEPAVDRYAAAVVERAGSLDVSVNAIGMDVGDQGIPLVDLTTEQFVAPLLVYPRAAFVTARAAARQMVRQGSGVLLSLSTPVARTPTALAGSFGPAFAAVESLTRQLAAELGPHGVRVVCLRPTGIPESTGLGSHTGQVWSRAAERLGVPLDQLLDLVSAGSALRRALTVAEVAEVAAFLASDRASGMTGTVANVSGGAVVD
jgi:NAD(P)-dependent dehydrogenase (short-subunit alcohol dehydrogenase family)